MTEIRELELVPLTGAVKISFSPAHAYVALTPGCLAYALCDWFGISRFEPEADNGLSAHGNIDVTYIPERPEVLMRLGKAETSTSLITSTSSEKEAVKALVDALRWVWAT